MEEENEKELEFEKMDLTPFLDRKEITGEETVVIRAYLETENRFKNNRKEKTLRVLRRKDNEEYLMKVNGRNFNYLIDKFGKSFSNWRGKEIIIWTETTTKPNLSGFDLFMR